MNAIFDETEPVWFQVGCFVGAIIAIAAGGAATVVLLSMLAQS